LKMLRDPVLDRLSGSAFDVAVSFSFSLEEHIS